MADNLFFADGSFRWPATLSDITSVPDECRQYFRYDASKKRHVLLKHVEEVFGPLRAEVEQLEAERVELPARYEREIAAHNAATVADSLRTALTAAGVASGLVAGAAAIMRDNYKLSVVESGGERYVAAETQYGTFGVDQLVVQFLESDDGEPFAGLKPAPSHFLSKLTQQPNDEQPR